MLGWLLLDMSLASFLGMFVLNMFLGWLFFLWLFNTTGEEANGGETIFSMVVYLLLGPITVVTYAFLLVVVVPLVTVINWCVNAWPEGLTWHEAVYEPKWLKKLPNISLKIEKVGD